ncbi:BON domain-containing protein [Aquitalea sp. ASV15]|uniref:BON domain-containing protein n=1 Tax=Aquitalea sp. ASV15 TaxID=2795104 RepID=UPI0018EBFCAE|nr:BON domain-containing protein [Aquitalea sp. ASV15]
MIKNDAQLQSDVLAELKWDPAVTATHIGVEANQGVITLSGHVANFAEKWAAEKATQRVVGVQAIAVEIAVDLPGSDKRSDADVSRATANALQLMEGSCGKSIKVMVENGWVTLSGDVEWDFQRKAAIRLLRHVSGVTGVSSTINIRPKLQMLAVKDEVEAALKRRAIADINSITVSIDGPDITLGGTVHSWSERALANHAAACLPGVRNVIDNIRVVI